MYTLSMPNFVFLEQLRRSLHDNDLYVECLQQVRLEPKSLPGFSIESDLLFFQVRFGCRRIIPSLLC